MSDKTSTISRRSGMTDLSPLVLCGSGIFAIAVSYVIYSKMVKGGSEAAPSATAAAPASADSKKEKKSSLGKTYFYEWECDEKYKKLNKCFICDVVGVKWTWLQNTPYIDREYTRFVCDDCADGDKGRSDYEIMYGPCIRKE